MVIPIREIPGNTAAPWNAPITAACHRATSFGILLPGFIQSATRSTTPVIKNPMPDASREPAAFSENPFIRSPTAEVTAMETNSSRNSLR